jgi:hypothetical protein
VAAAWYKLYGFRKVRDRYVGEISLWNPRLWLVFALHDIGYIGKTNMDDEQGETHPATGARIVGTLFGEDWWWFSLLHSRYYAKRLEMQPSLLCIAEKLSLAITPGWLYLPAVRATGEIKEYMRLDLARHAAGEVQRNITYAHEQRAREREELWFRDVQKYMRDWVEEHKDGREDTWTKSGSQGTAQYRADYVVDRTSITESGVTQ